MMHIYNDKDYSGKWIKCTLLHEFLESYQISFMDPETGREVEKVVKRDCIREVCETGERRYG